MSATVQTDANDELTIEDIAAANDQAVREILVRLRAGTLVKGQAPIAPGLVVGTGQSMGGGVTIIMQGRHRTYDAIAPLGYSPVHTSLPQRRPEMREAIKSVFAKFSRATPPQDLSVPHSSEQIPDFLYPFHCEDVPQDILQADLAGGYPLRQSPPSWGSATVPRCVVAMMSPGYVAAEAAEIDVPVFLGFGERDVSEAPHREPIMFARARDITVYVAPRMAHMHNFASTRELLWNRTLDWLSLRRTRRAGGRRESTACRVGADHARPGSLMRCARRMPAWRSATWPSATPCTGRQPRSVYARRTTTRSTREGCRRR